MEPKPPQQNNIIKNQQNKRATLKKQSKFLWSQILNLLLIFQTQNQPVVGSSLKSLENTTKFSKAKPMNNNSKSKVNQRIIRNLRKI